MHFSNIHSTLHPIRLKHLQKSNASEMFLKKAGIFLLPFSIVYYFFIDSISYFSIIFFLLGIVFIGIALLAKKKKFPFSLQLTIVIIPFLSMVAYYFWFKRPYNQKIIVPENFKGMVLIGYANPNGKAIEWDGFNRIIHLNKKGEALTIDEWYPLTNAGTDFYYLNSKKELITIPFHLVQNIDFDDTSKVYVFPGDHDRDCWSFIIETEPGAKKYFEDPALMHLNAPALLKQNQFIDSIQ